VGYNYRMNEFQAALVTEQLKLLDGMLATRRKMARFYDRRLAKTKGLSLPKVAPDRTHDWYAYVVRAIGVGREELQRRLKSAGVETSNLFDPVYGLKAYRDMPDMKWTHCPVAEELRDGMSIPLHPGLSEDDLEYVARSIEKALA
jgi:perosamine synthetase